MLPAAEVEEGASRLEAAGIPPRLGGCQPGGTTRWAAKRAVDVGRRVLE